ncbi:ubiquitin-conjugating enzyme/RWD-like protein [Tanacetum coccineum]
MVHVKDEMNVKKGACFLYCAFDLKEFRLALSSSATKAESRIKEILEANQSSLVGIFSMEDVSGDEDDDTEFSPITIFSSNSSPVDELPIENIFAEWIDLKNRLPGTQIFVKVYEDRMDLLRAVIIGPKKDSLMHYRSGGLGINPNLNKSGEVRLSLPKTSGGEEDMWVERVSESSFMHENDIMHENKNTPYEEELHYDDPFKIYDILNMNKDNVGKSLDEGFKYPLGFTPVDEYRDKREAQIINEPEVQNVILNKNNETWSTSGIFSARSKDSRFLKYKLEVLFKR